MVYARKLTFALRVRGAGEEMIADVLKDCRARELDDSDYYRPVR